MRFFIEMLRDEEGATAVEYAIMLFLILVAVIGGIGGVGEATGGMWGGIRDELISFGVGD